MKTTLDTACEFLAALKRYRERMSPEERAAYDRRIEERAKTDPLGVMDMFKPNPLFKTLTGK